MKLLDLAGFDDVDYFSMHLEDGFGEIDFTDSVVLLPAFYVGEAPAFAGARHICRLKVPFGRSSQRFFLAALFLYSTKLHSSAPEYFCFEESDQMLGERARRGGIVYLLYSIFQWIDGGGVKKDDLKTFRSFLESPDLDALGEVGISFKSSLSKANLVLNFYLDRVFSEKFVSSGFLRSLEIAPAIVEHWRFLTDTQQSSRVGEEPMLARLSRIETLVKGCYLGTSNSKLDYSSQYWPFLFSSTSGWFYRSALTYRSLGMESCSVMAIVRAFELILQAQTLRCGVGELSVTNGEFYVGRLNISGCGSLVDLIERGKVSTSINTCDLNDWVIRARTLLSVRNSSRLAHGILDINAQDFNVLFGNAKSLIEEFSDPDLYAEFDGAFQDLKPPNLKGLIGPIFDKYIGGYIERLV
ncbi:hypothetical protein [Pseudomonas sp. Gutcm_11s]|uniref:hypothetical protein n=1 Tax=Pseudomonas sp. Gutcm_11s TaxID=3026088 RepID=UPI002362B148|nr:hypothetical protein [Pseudomonas sp. Gutcm_11s]MDD0841180.1 hypothetical protein [Pseudomonas sp. Gutcm_11s]